MARLTLLEMVQDILNDADSDPVDSYTDTVESQQVAQILRTTYFNIIDGKDWPHLSNLFQLTETSPTTPTHLNIANTIVKVLWFKYDKGTSTDTRTRYLEVCYKEPKDFLELLNGRVSDASNVSIITEPSGLSLNVYTDRAPQFYTSFTDDAVVRDSYDSAVETYLRTARTQCFGRRYPSVTLTDGFYFDLPTEMFSYLLAEAPTCGLPNMNFQPAQYLEFAKNLDISHAECVLAFSGIECPFTLDELGIDARVFKEGKFYPYRNTELKEAIADRYRVQADQVLLLGGGTSLPNFLIGAALLQPGDRVLMEYPTYEPLESTLAFSGAQIVHFERKFSNRFDVEIERLAELIRPPVKLIALTRLHNPSGRDIPEEALLKLAQRAEAINAYVLPAPPPPSACLVLAPDS